MRPIVPAPAVITEPGFYEITAEAYHADPCETPSLSASIAGILDTESPAHAYVAHPRLGYEPDETDISARLDLGSVVHKLMLGRGRDIVTIDADDFRTKAAKAERDEARAAGKLPILAKDLARAGFIEASALQHVRSIPGCETAFTDEAGASEVAMVWKDRAGPWCRSLIDWMPNDRRILWDIKTVARTANPEHAGRLIQSHGYELPASFYERGLTHLEPDLAGRVKFRWVLVEIEPPFACSVVELDGVGLDAARRKVERALDIWSRCLGADRWPAYPPQIAVVEYPTYAADRLAEREMREHDARRPDSDRFNPDFLMAG